MLSWTVKPLLVLVGNCRQFLCSDMSNDEYELMLQHERTGRPLGSKQFMEQLESQLGRILIPQRGAGQIKYDKTSMMSPNIHRPLRWIIRILSITIDSWFFTDFPGKVGGVSLYPLLHTLLKVFPDHNHRPLCSPFENIQSARNGVHHTDKFARIIMNNFSTEECGLRKIPGEQANNFKYFR